MHSPGAKLISELQSNDTKDESIAKCIQLLGLLRYYLLFNKVLLNPIMYGNFRLRCFTDNFSLFLACCDEFVIQLYYEVVALKRLVNSGCSCCK
jgi:hypothetical protein